MIIKKFKINIDKVISKKLWMNKIVEKNEVIFFKVKLFKNIIKLNWYKKQINNIFKKQI